MGSTLPHGLEPRVRLFPLRWRGIYSTGEDTSVETILSLQRIQRVCVICHEPERGLDQDTNLSVGDCEVVLGDDPDREHAVEFGLKKRQRNQHLSVR